MELAPTVSETRITIRSATDTTARSTSGEGGAPRKTACPQCRKSAGSAANASWRAPIRPLRARRKHAWSRGKYLQAACLSVGVPYLNLTGCSGGSGGVYQNDALRAGPAVHQREALAASSMTSTPGGSTASVCRRRATSTPAASSPRSKLPQPMMRRGMMRKAMSSRAPDAGGGNGSRRKCRDRSCAPPAHTSR